MDEKLKSFFEVHAFGVCSYLGEKMNIQPSRIRLFFLYSSFITLGSPILIYLSLAFLLNMKKYIKPKRYTVWDL